MVAVSISHKTASLDLRQKFAFDEEKTKSFLSFLGSNKNCQAVFVSTCNRCEVYTTADSHSVILALCKFSGAQAQLVKKIAFVYEGNSAAQHLFSVCCGLDSMVLGEDEILGQVKRAFAFAAENGFTGYELNTVFKAAITSAKKIKTETLLSKSSVSIATLVCSKCRKAAAKGKTVLIIGAGGEIGGKTLKNLLSYNEFEIFAAARKRHIPKNGVHLIDYDERYSYADKADIIISATKSPHYTFTYEKLCQVLKTKKPRLFVDLAVPRDIDRDVLLIVGSELVTIDDFEKIASENCRLKKRELVSAEEIMNSDVDELCREMLFHDNRELIERIFGREKINFAYKFRDNADAPQFRAFIDVLKKMEENQ